MNNKEKSTLMYMSWEIQTAKNWTRQKALTSAWAITKTLPIALKYLRSQQHKKRIPVAVTAEGPTLF